MKKSRESDWSALRLLGAIVDVVVDVVVAVDGVLDREQEV